MSDGRYIRQTRLAGFGPEGQKALGQAAVLVVGLGGLGIPAALYLNAMGVGRLGLLDADRIETSNLHRQPLYRESQIGTTKVSALAHSLRAQNPETRLDCMEVFLTPENALEILGDYDLILDATDNLPTRYLLDDACLILGKPWIYGALHGFEGQVSVFNYRGGPTYRCLFPDPPDADTIPDCSDLGILGVLPGIIGMFQALEAVKIIAGLSGVLSGQLCLYDGLSQETRGITVPRNPDRPQPGQLQQTYALHCPSREYSISWEEFRLRQGRSQTMRLVDVRERYEYKADGLEEAVNLPLASLSNHLDNLNGANPLVLVCRSGPRSRKARRFLAERFPDKDIFWISGGMQAIKSDVL